MVQTIFSTNTASVITCGVFFHTPSASFVIRKKFYCVSLFLFFCVFMHHLCVSFYIFLASFNEHLYSIHVQLVVSLLFWGDGYLFFLLILFFLLFFFIF